MVCGEWYQTARDEERRKECKLGKKKGETVLSYKASFNSLTCRGYKPIKLASYDTVCRSREHFLAHIPFHLLPSFLHYSCLLHPLCPCHNFISMHVISKLALNEFLISMNSVTVLIRFIVFRFTIPHIGGRSVKGRNRNSEIGQYLDRKTEAEAKMLLTSGCCMVFYHPIFISNESRRICVSCGGRRQCRMKREGNG